MSSRVSNIQAGNQVSTQLAKTEYRTHKESTVTTARSERVVVTRQQKGELKLRYAPVEQLSVVDGQTSAQ